MAKAEVRIGTSAFTAAGWPGTFYPEGMKPADYLSFYSTKFDTVEVDSTFYRSPSPSVVRGWYEKTPKNFVFALKFPQIVTHEKVLRDCDDDCKTFLAAADLLQEKLGPLLFQFGYFNKTVFKSADDFVAVLAPFLDKLPKGYKFAVEIRNKNWLLSKFVDVLRQRGVALALVDHSWLFPTAEDWFSKFDPLTTDFTYVRLLGDRKGIEQQTKVWDKIIIDKKKELKSWSDVCQKTMKRGVSTYVYANNHYQGYGPGTAELIRKFLAGAK